MATLVKENGTYVIKPGDDLKAVGRSIADLFTPKAAAMQGPQQVQGPQPVAGYTPPVVPGVSAKTKSKGDPAILAKQKELNKMGAGLVEDGILGPLTKAAIAKYSKPSTQNLGITQPGAPAQPTGGSISDVLAQILRDAQKGNADRYTGNNTALLRGKENIQETNAGVYSQDFANANLTNEARLSLLGNDNSIQDPGLRSITDQQNANEAHYKSTNDIIKSTQDSYDKEQDRVHQAATDAADQAYKNTVLSETKRHNLASEKIDSTKASSTITNSGLFGSAKLTTGQKSDVADMLTLQKQIASLQGLGQKNGGFVGASGGGLGSVQGAFEKITGLGFSGGQDTRNAIGQIKGFIAKLRGGTSFTPNEQALLDTYTPGINDSDSVISSKLNSLNQYINDKLESTAMVAGGTYTPEAKAPAGGGIIYSPDKKLKLDTSELTPSELAQAKADGWK